MRILAAILLAAIGTLARAGDPDMACTLSPQTAAPPATSITLVRASFAGEECWVARTANFRVCWSASDEEVRALARRCETLAAATKETWLGKHRSADWTPKCDVVVHPHLASYVQFLGPGSEQTTGCATIRLEARRIVARRIDLRADGPGWNSEILPHELTHVVLADHFCNSQIPPWADEGIAMLAESPPKLKQRLADMRQATVGGLVYTPRDLVGVKSAPDPAFRAAFYGQSLALVSVLLDWGTRKQLFEFVELSQTKGFDAAVGEIYGNQRLCEFERQYRHCLVTDRPLAWSGQRVVAAAIGPPGSQ